MSDSKLFVSVDMDEWYFIRWVYGASHSVWKDLDTLFKDVYGKPNPIGEIYEPTERILSLFDELNFKSTFFFTGYIASHYPDLVKKIAAAGHEIGCHNFYHLDYEYETTAKFKTDLFNSKKMLEDLSGQAVVGYRSPNSSIPAKMVEILLEAGFLYDSSVTPTRRIMGKFGNFENSPLHPYVAAKDNVGEEGDSGLLEFPWAVFPLLHLPAGSGIMHRIGGNLYNRIATDYSMRKGTVGYYFHPYELGSAQYYEQYANSFTKKIFTRNIGQNYSNMLREFLFRYKNELVNGITLYKTAKEKV